MLGAIESLMTAVVSDRMSGGRHNPNVELIGQGVANIFSPLFGGLPATGAIARTATNIRAGAKTPVAGMVHALTLLAIVVWAAPLARFIPLSVLAAILFVVSYKMGEWREIPELLRLSRLEVATWLITFALTVFADLTVAVEVGMILAAFVFIRKVTATTTVSQVTEEYLREGHAHFLQHKEMPLLCDHLPHPRTLPFRGHGQSRADHLPPFGVAAHHHPSPSQYDRHRRHRTSGSGRLGGCRACLRARTDSLRSERATFALNAPSRIRAARRIRKYLQQHFRSAGPRQGGIPKSAHARVSAYREAARLARFSKAAPVRNPDRDVLTLPIELRRAERVEAPQPQLRKSFPAGPIGDPVIGIRMNEPPEREANHK
jgi:hypothetical protein